MTQPDAEPGPAEDDTGLFGNDRGIAVMPTAHTGWFVRAALAKRQFTGAHLLQALTVAA